MIQTSYPYYIDHIPYVFLSISFKLCTCPLIEEIVLNYEIFYGPGK
jgi:hypothetical protein